MTTTVADVMQSASIATVKPEDDLALATQVMLWTGVRHLPVVRRNEVVGVLSERDVLRRQSVVGARTAAREPVEAAMTRSPAVIEPGAPLVSALTIMQNRRLGCLPVVTQGRLVGILTSTDLLRHDLEQELARPATRLLPSVGSIMSPEPAVVTADMELFDAAALMAERKVRHLPVVDGWHHLVGVVSDRDVRTAVGDPRQLLDDVGVHERLRLITVGDAMTKDPVAVRSDAGLDVAMGHLLRDRIGAVAVVDPDRKVVGMLSFVDVIRALR